MKSIRVAAAIIIQDNKVLATQKGYGNYKGKWEFPGGKIEAGETPQEALVREMLEEMDTLVEVGDLMMSVSHDYPEFHMDMDCFYCTVLRGDLVLKEHLDARWLDRDSVDTLDWLPADAPVIQKLKDEVLQAIND